MKTFTLFLSAALFPTLLPAAPLRSAEVSKVVNDVRVYRPSESGRAVSIGEKLSGAASLHTGRKSRAELLFQDRTVTRIGASSIFSFRNGTRDMEIKQGSFLLQVPKNAGGVSIRTGTVTAAITGTTTMMEYNPGQWLKFITLEGSAKLRLNAGGPSVDIPPGRMVMMRPDADQIPKPVVINIRKLVKTSRLLDEGDFGALDPEAKALVQATIREQDGQRNQGDLVPTGVLVNGPGVRKLPPAADAGGGRNPILQPGVTGFDDLISPGDNESPGSPGTNPGIITGP